MSELKPCPHCGESLVEHADDHGTWWAHKNEPAPCAHGVTQLFDNEDFEAWNRRTPSLPASAEGGEAIDFVQELYSELRHQVNNCPVCKGEGMAVDVFDVLTKPEPREKTPCNRCSRARSLLDRVKPALKAEDSLHG